MLLRSYSTPILNSRIPSSNPRESPVEYETLVQISRTRSIALSASCSSSLSFPYGDHSIREINRTLSETDLKAISFKSGLGFMNEAPVLEIEDEGEEMEEKGIGFGFGLELEEESEVMIRAGLGGKGGKIYGGGGGGGSDGGDGKGGYNHGNDRTDVFYQKMIEANPGNSLLLGNYARFLKEVRADFSRAEEYCGKAILANPSDGNVLSMYADLIWRSHRDASRAESYFDQAVKAAPDDCYVLALYAHFLWDAEKDDDDDEEEPLIQQASHPNFFNGYQPLAVAS